MILLYIIILVLVIVIIFMAYHIVDMTSKYERDITMARNPMHGDMYTDNTGMHVYKDGKWIHL